jgi:hypothetical protein
MLKQVIHVLSQVLLAGLVAWPLSACKTAGSSNVKDAGDITNGLEVGQGDGKPFTWANQMGLTLSDGDNGAAVTATRMASFATAVGFAKGDVITALNGTAVTGAQSFETAADGWAGNGDQVSQWNGEWVFTVQRGGNGVTLKRPDGYLCDPYVLANCGPFGPGEQ